MTIERRPFPAQRLLLGISGSIAAATMGQGILWIRQVLGVPAIRVAMTRRAASMIPQATIAAFSGGPVYVDFADAAGDLAPHITLAGWADVFVVMPATANLIAKVAHGIADDLLSTCILAAECPVVFAPAMNGSMWGKPATQRNVAQLQADGYALVPPTRGVAISDGQRNDAAMADLPTVMQRAATLLGDAASVRSRREVGMGGATR